MALVVGINSYVTVDEADEYCADRYGYEAWEEADDKEKALISAADILDSLCLWHGYRVDRYQALAFPRSYVADPVPQGIKNAQCEIAFSIVSTGSVSTEGDAALEELKAGSVTLKFKAKTTKNPLINSVAMSFLQPYGVCGMGSTKIIPVQRG